MPIMSLIEKGDTSSKDALDKPKEKRCYFGLLSLRSGTAVISALTLIFSAYFGLTITRKDLVDKRIPYFETKSDFFIPLPFTNDRGISFLTLYGTLTSFLAIYGVYTKSPKAIKLYRNISCFDLAWTFGCFGYIGYEIYTGMEAKPPTDPDMPERFREDIFKWFGLLLTSIAVTSLWAEAYNIYVVSQYEKLLLFTEKEEKKKTEKKGAI